MYSKEDLDEWIGVIAAIVDEAYAKPEMVKTAPHAQPIHQIRSAPLEDPKAWAMTWRAHRRKHGKGKAGG